MSPAADERALLRELTRRYLHTVRDLSVDAVRAHQLAPWGNIGHGAVGVAYVLWRVGRARGKRGAELIDRAHAWWRAAAQASGEAGAFTSEAPPPLSASMTAPSLADGPPGLPFVGALIADARGEVAARDAHLDAFARACDATAGRPRELLHGTAGLLVGALALERVTGAARARAIADRLAFELLSDPRTLAPHADPAFAHGQAGVLSSLVQWSSRTGAHLPEAALAAIDAIDPHRVHEMQPALRASWCNGAAGMTLLFVHAYESTGRELHRERALTAARLMTSTARAAVGNLCCGLGGCSYALLALARIAPGRNLRPRARSYATRAASRMDSAWPHGLLRGWPGLICLAADLEEDAAAARFPLVEA